MKFFKHIIQVDRFQYGKPGSCGDKLHCNMTHFINSLSSVENTWKRNYINTANECSSLDLAATTTRHLQRQFLVMMSFSNYVLMSVPKVMQKLQLVKVTGCSRNSPPVWRAFGTGPLKQTEKRINKKHTNLTFLGEGFACYCLKRASCSNAFSCCYKIRKSHRQGVLGNCLLKSEPFSKPQQLVYFSIVGKRGRIIKQTSDL